MASVAGSKHGSGFYRLATTLIRPLLALPFPGRWKVFGALINAPERQPQWDGAGLRWTRSKIHGFFIPCDLSVFSGRIAWFFRRWYELDTQSAIITLLPKGGSFVDIGANVGMATLTAVAAAGREGHFMAFEPNPAVGAIFAESMQRNGLGQVELKGCAIGEQAGELEFFVPENNHGEGSLGTDFGDRPGKLIRVKVCDGSAINALDRLDLVKIDVEGFEQVGLQAIQPAIARHRPMIVSELMDEHLRRAGTTSGKVLTMMAGLGYAAFRIQVAGAGLLPPRAILLPVPPDENALSANVLFAPEEKAVEVARLSFAALPK